MDSYNLTVGIPVYNEKESIKKCLEAIRLSDLPERTQIIICDNGSTDGNLEIIRENKGLEIKIVQESAIGKVFVMNKIIAESLSDYIIFCDADILVERQTFKKMADELKASGSHVLGINLTDISKDSFFTWYYRQFGKIKDHSLDKSLIWGGCFGISKSKFIKLPPVLSIDYFISAYYYVHDQGAALVDGSICAYYKRVNTFTDVIAKRIRNRLKYLQVIDKFPELSRFPYKAKARVNYHAVGQNLSLGTLSVCLLNSLFNATASIIGTVIFYLKLKNVGCTWKKSISTTLADISSADLENGTGSNDGNKL